MILEGSKSADVLSTGSEESISMSIDTADQGVLMMILSESLYKDPIGSLIREWTSNALDAHTEAGVTDPIVVSLKSDEQYNYWFKVTDVGTGMSPERITNVISKYAASTKRLSDKYLGAFGLGLKSGLAYSDSFTIITRYEGVEYTYTMYKGENGTKIDLMRDIPTQERNGTTVQIQIKDTSDKFEFIKKIKEQLCYFEGVSFDVPGVGNDFTILKNADWKYSTMNTSSQIHLVLNNVFYAIDWQRLGIDPIYLPIGLAFEVGEGLIPTPSREDIKYTDEAKELIMIRLAGLADYLVGKYNESMTEREYWGDIYEKFEEPKYILEAGGMKIELKLDEIKEYSYLKPALPSLKGVKLLDLKALSKKTAGMFGNYEIRGRIQSYGNGFYGKYTEQPKDLMKHPNLIFTDHAPKGVELEYIKDVVGHCYFLYKKHEKQLGKLWSGRWYGDSPSHISQYITLLDLKKKPKSLWREMIKEYQSIEASILVGIRKIENYQPTLEWLEERKAKRAKRNKRVLQVGFIPLKIGRGARRGDNNMVFETKEIPVKQLMTSKMLSVYGLYSQREQLDRLFCLTTPNKKGKLSNLRVVMMAKSDVKKIKGMHNFISIEDFMEGKSRQFKRIATGRVVKKFIDENKDVFNSYGFIKHLSTDVSSKLLKLAYYEKENNPTDYNVDQDIMNEITKVAEEHNLWDHQIHDLMNEMVETIKVFDFIKSFDHEKIRNTSPDTLALSREILKGRKFKMDWQNYLPPPVTPLVQIEEEGEEEILEEIAEKQEDLSDIPF